MFFLMDSGGLNWDCKQKGSVFPRAKAKLEEIGEPLESIGVACPLDNTAHKNLDGLPSVEAVVVLARRLDSQLPLELRLVGK